MLRPFAIGTFILAIVFATWYLPGHILWLVPDSIRDNLGPMQRTLLSDVLYWLGMTFSALSAASSLEDWTTPALHVDSGARAYARTGRHRPILNGS